MRARQLILWIAIGLIGLALAAGVTYAATQLSSQRIGLSAEPPSAGDDLASPSAPRIRDRGEHEEGEPRHVPGNDDGDHDEDD